MIMAVETLLRIARQTVAKMPSCMAITVDQQGEANARVVQTSPLSDDWTLRFMTDRRSRKAREIARTGRLTLAYQNDADGAYVSLIGRATIVDDPAIKQAVWRPASLRWHPGGPTDPNVVLVDFTAERIELWSTPHGVMPDPAKGLWAAALSRDGGNWREHVTLPSL
jgi:general stress protein 26